MATTFEAMGRGSSHEETGLIEATPKAYGLDLSRGKAPAPLEEFSLSVTGYLALAGEQAARAAQVGGGAHQAGVEESLITPPGKDFRRAWTHREVPGTN